MLKWLVTKSPSGVPLPPQEILTDDPLATLRRNGAKHEPVYSVSRVNPLFEEESSIQDLHHVIKEHTKISTNRNEKIVPESPPTDHESVRSSGYGSKEADSVSYQSDTPEEEDAIIRGSLQSPSDISEESVESKFSFNSPGTVAELRKSFENLSSDKRSIHLEGIEVLHQNSNFVKAIDIGHQRSFSLESIPEISYENENCNSNFSRAGWPRVSHLAQKLQKKSVTVSDKEKDNSNKKKIIQNNENNKHRNQNLRFNPLVSVVAQDGKYVTAISVSPGRPHPPQHKDPKSSYFQQNTKLGVDTRSGEIPHYFSQKESSIHNNEFPLLSLQMDSLVNEDTLRMMNFPGYENKNYRYEDNPHLYDAVSLTDMPDFGRALFSGLNSSVKNNYARQPERPRSHPSTTKRLSRSSVHTIRTKKKGVSVVKDLWEKSGLKTNGRKLLVDINELIDDKVNECGNKLSERPDHFRSIPSMMHIGVSDYHGVSSTSDRSSIYYSSIASVHSPSSHWNSDMLSGIDNPAFVDDRSLGSASSSKNVQFQHNMTDFQKRLSDRLQNHWNEDGAQIDDVISRRSSSVKSSYSKKLSSRPAKVIREFGLSDTDWRRSYNTSTNGSKKTFIWRSNNRKGFGSSNRQQFWESFQRGKSKDQYNYYTPHPNGDAPICKPLGICHDFTLDSHKLHLMVKNTSRKERRRQLCTCFIVLCALLSFIGIIIGISWFYTDGKRIFGSM